MQLEGMKRWIRTKASARKFCSGKQAAREVAPLLAVIAAFLKGYQTFFHPVVLPEEMGPDCWEVPHTQLGQISWIRSSSPAHPWHCACEGYGKSEGSLCFHHALQGDNPSRTTNACHLVIPRISLFHPRTTASKKKNCSENYSVLSTSFTIWVVRAHLQIWVNALPVLALKVLQMCKQCHTSLTKRKTKGADCGFAWC